MVYFVLTFVFVFFQGRKMQRAQRKRATSGTAAASLAEQTPLGIWFQVYTLGFTEVHVYAWFCSTALCFLYFIMSRIVVNASPDKCISWADWTGNWDKCVPLVAVDTQGLAYVANFNALCFL